MPVAACGWPKSSCLRRRRPRAPARSTPPPHRDAIAKTDGWSGYVRGKAHCGPSQCPCRRHRSMPLAASCRGCTPSRAPARARRGAARRLMPTPSCLASIAHGLSSDDVRRSLQPRQNRLNAAVRLARCRLAGDAERALPASSRSNRTACGFALPARHFMPPPASLHGRAGFRARVARGLACGIGMLWWRNAGGGHIRPKTMPGAGQRAGPNGLNQSGPQ